MHETRNLAPLELLDLKEEIAAHAEKAVRATFAHDPAALRVIDDNCVTMAHWVKLHHDLEVMGSISGLFPFSEGETWRVLDAKTVSLNRLGHFAIWSGAELSTDEAAPILNLATDWALPGGTATPAAIVELLLVGGAKQVGTTAWALEGILYDLDGFKIDRKPPVALIAFGVMGGLKEITDPATVMYLRLSLALAGTDHGNARDKIRGITRVATVTAAQNDGMGHYDPAALAMVKGKAGLVGLSWNHRGFVLADLTVDTRKAFELVFKAIPGKYRAHNQLKYLVTAASLGILQRDGRAWSIKAVAKGFARMKQGLPAQTVLLRHDVNGQLMESFDESAFIGVSGEVHQGRAVWVLLAPGLIPLPYLGAIVALQDRETIGREFLGYTPYEIAGSFVGRHELELPAIGTAVEEQAVLVAGGPVVVESPRKGTVLEALSYHDESKDETFYLVKLGVPDGTGQGKKRRLGVKGSDHHNAFTNVPWDKVADLIPELQGLPMLAQGDAAVFGLEPGDAPMYALGEDAWKGGKTGDPQAMVAAAVDTLAVLDPDAF